MNRSSDPVLAKPLPFDSLTAQPADGLLPLGLLALIGMHACDARPNKLDLTVGVYRDDCGGVSPRDVRLAGHIDRILADHPAPIEDRISDD